MTNREIAAQFNLLSKLIELHGESSFKSRSYTNAYLNIKKSPKQLSEMNAAEMHDMKGIGKAIQAKIQELLQTGEMQTLNRYLDKTPVGVQELLSIKGFGPKKVKIVWEDLGIESTGELLYAITENRLVELKGFGAKTQETLKQQLEYHLESKGKLLYAIALPLATELEALLRAQFTNKQTTITGAVARKCDIIEKFTVLTEADTKSVVQLFQKHEDFVEADKVWYYKNMGIDIIHSDSNSYNYDLAKANSDPAFWAAVKIPAGNYGSEEAVFEDNKLPYYIPEYREPENVSSMDSYVGAQNVITEDLSLIHI